MRKAHRDGHKECLFDGVKVIPAARYEGFQIRDVAAGSDFLDIGKEAAGIRLTCRKTIKKNAVMFDVEVSSVTPKDRAITLVYTIPVDASGLRWLDNLRKSVSVVRGCEYMKAALYNEEILQTTVALTAGGPCQYRATYKMDAVGANCRISNYPFAAVADDRNGTAIGIDMDYPAFFRVGYNADTEELFIAYDLGFTREKPAARLRFCRFSFDPRQELRGAWAKYYSLFPEHFRCRTPSQGIWMPFASIRGIPGWKDFGFKFKEGHGEQKWEHAHGIISFRYTEPFTWWMPVPPELPHTAEVAEKEARRRAEQGDLHAAALPSSASYNRKGKPDVRMCSPAWCRHGSVWSFSSLPGIKGRTTDFKLKWSRKIRDELYKPTAEHTPIGGEYIDSSEGYITSVLDFRREFFKIAATPLTFAHADCKPAIFRGLSAFEYMRAIARDVHALGKLMMANSTPGRIPWLAPLLDVMGTETNWNHGGKWTPMADTDMMYFRAMCKGKPYCFLMNTPFQHFTREMTEKYMKRCVAYGMFPGFFSHNAMEDAYFGNPKLYDRDRLLFKKYVPLCKTVGEAGWEPITRAHSDHEKVYVERFGRNYLTVFNDTDQTRKVTITLDGLRPGRSRELVTGNPVKWRGVTTTLSLKPECVAVIRI